MIQFLIKKKWLKIKKAFLSRFNEYKKQKELQEYMNNNYRTLKLPKIE